MNNTGDFNQKIAAAMLVDKIWLNDKIIGGKTINLCRFIGGLNLNFGVHQERGNFFLFENVQKERTHQKWWLSKNENVISEYGVLTINYKYYLFYQQIEELGIYDRNSDSFFQYFLKEMRSLLDKQSEIIGLKFIEEIINNFIFGQRMMYLKAFGKLVYINKSDDFKKAYKNLTLKGNYDFVLDNKLVKVNNLVVSYDGADGKWYGYFKIDRDVDLSDNIIHFIVPTKKYSKPIEPSEMTKWIVDLEKKELQQQQQQQQQQQPLYNYVKPFLTSTVNAFKNSIVISEKFLQEVNIYDLLSTAVISEMILSIGQFDWKYAVENSFVLNNKEMYKIQQKLRIIPKNIEHLKAPIEFKSPSELVF